MRNFYYDSISRIIAEDKFIPYETSIDRKTRLIPLFFRHSSPAQPAAVVHRLI